MLRSELKIFVMKGLGARTYLASLASHLLDLGQRSYSSDAISRIIQDRRNDRGVDRQGRFKVAVGPRHTRIRIHHSRLTVSLRD